MKFRWLHTLELLFDLLWGVVPLNQPAAYLPNPALKEERLYLLLGLGLATVEVLRDSQDPPLMEAQLDSPSTAGWNLRGVLRHRRPWGDLGLPLRGIREAYRPRPATGELQAAPRRSEHHFSGDGAEALHVIASVEQQIRLVPLDDLAERLKRLNPEIGDSEDAHVRSGRPTAPAVGLWTETEWIIGVHLPPAEAIFQLCAVGCLFPAFLVAAVVRILTPAVLHSLNLGGGGHSSLPG